MRTELLDVGIFSGFNTRQQACLSRRFSVRFLCHAPFVAFLYHRNKRISCKSLQSKHITRWACKGKNHQGQTGKNIQHRGMDRRKLQIKHICRSEGTFTAIDTRSCLRIYFPPQKCATQTSTLHFHIKPLTENHSVMDSTLNSVVLNENARLNPAFDQWELNMTHAYHEGLEATGFEPPGAPPVLVKPQEKPRDNRHCL